MKKLKIILILNCICRISIIDASYPPASPAAAPYADVKGM